MIDKNVSSHDELERRIRRILKKNEGVKHGLSIEDTLEWLSNFKPNESCVCLRLLEVLLQNYYIDQKEYRKLCLYVVRKNETKSILS